MPTSQPGQWKSRPFHLMAKPTGARCNLSCRYCFFLEKEGLYPDSHFRMSDEVQEEYIRQTLATQPTPEVTITWQGGEPTLMGLPFYRRAVDLSRQFAKPGQRVSHQIQTNGTLLDDEWCEFLHDNRFLVGISLDGPAFVHDPFRVDRGGRPTFESVIRGLRLLQKHEVDFNILACIHSANQDHPLEVYRFFRDEVQTDWVQFIPIVEKVPGTGKPDGTWDVTARSVDPLKFGSFLSAIFDEWVRHDVGRMFVQTFEVAVRCWMGLPPLLCVHSETCGDAMVLEHNGDVYSCDHFVTPENLLGNLMEMPILQIAYSGRQNEFGLEKRNGLPDQCRSCEVRFACHGGCPKDRIICASDGKPGLNYLCAGYKVFFRHIDTPMRMIAGLLDRGRPADEIIPLMAAKDDAAAKTVGRNDPCPCGSGRKFKKCCGQAVPH